MPTRALIGTCITRLAFANNGLGADKGDLPELSFDFERTSVISLISQPMEPDPLWLPVGLEEHERRWIEQDFRKDFWGFYLPLLDFLYLDFLGDRLTIVESPNQRSAFKQLCLGSRDNPAVIPERYILHRCPQNGQDDTDGYLALWENAFYAFFYKVKALNPRCRIMVHEFSLGTIFDDGEPFGPHEVFTYSDFYARAHAIARGFPLVTTFKPAAPAIAARAHGYGPAPYHLTKGYSGVLTEGILAFEDSV
jgi:hypothetical protein